MNPPRPQAFHIAKQYFTCEVYLTNPAGLLFGGCSTLYMFPARRDLITFSLTAKIKEVPPLGWRQADVHRTSAFRWVQVPFQTKNKGHPFGCPLFFGGRGGT